MSAPCPTCLPINCFQSDDADIYSLERPLYPFVLDCPPGYDCSNNKEFKIMCCGQLLSVQFPSNATAEDKLTLETQLLNQCSAILDTCGDNKNPPPPPPPPTTTLYLNRDKSCTVKCPDGNSYVFTVFAGTFAATSPEQADQDAQNYACVQAGLRRLCLGNLSGCLCVGAAYSSSISHTGGIAPFAWSITDGALPTGLTLDQTGTISGTPTTNGTYNFTVRITSDDGSFMQKPYKLTVLEITTTAITGFTVGTPYSFQLQAAGGSGNYAWAITSGTLPDGLTMSLTGLISGTPTSSTASTLTLKVIDTTCESTNQSFFPPNAKLVTASQTTIATVIGFPEYVGFESVPPKKYKRITWSGTSEQTWFVQTDQIAGAKIEYTGSTEINVNGTYLQFYSKNLSEMCTKADDLCPGITGFFPTAGYKISGWTGPAGSKMCDPPAIPYDFVEDQAIAEGVAALYDSTPFCSGLDGQTGVFFKTFAATSATTAQDTGTGQQDGLALTTNPRPCGTLLGINYLVPPLGFTGSVLWNHNYSATLDLEYTDADALSVARVINGNGATAQNLPRTTGFVSSFTTVAFTLQCANLLVGQSYVVSYDLFDTTAGTSSTVQIGFVAAATTKSISGTVPNPAPGHSVTIRNPRIIFTP